MRSYLKKTLLSFMIMGLFLGCTRSHDQPFAHYLIHAKKGTIQHKDSGSRLVLLTLEDVRTSVSYFISHPKTRTGALSLLEFISLWNKKHQELKQVILKSLLLYFDAKGQQHEDSVEVVNLEWGNEHKVLRFILKMDQEEVFAESQALNDVTLMIDLSELGEVEK